MQDIDFYIDAKNRTVGFYKDWAYWAGFGGMYTHRCTTKAGIGAGTELNGSCHRCKQPLTPEIKSIVDGLYALLGHFK